ncbi:hypothetical protein RDI58_015771 [Solanum bulbocastanum]|uniref:Uncharacterized protein n=1 Tax=Solanum bulbocastanum TaxID=147425 RepID=A0AAN8TKP7_SOLBU
MEKRVAALSSHFLVANSTGKTH